MRTAVLLIFVALVPAPDVLAQGERPGREQERAATAAAVRGLVEAVSRETIAPDVSVARLLEETHGHERLTQELSRAQTIGGTRWVGNTAQVRLEISGSRAAQALVNIAAGKPRRSPIPPDVLAVRLKDWHQRTFSATGSSTGAAEIEHARPRGEAPAWRTISDDARRAAVAAAKDNAVGAILSSIAPVKLPDGKTVGEVLKEPAVRDALRQWLAARPVTQVEFRDDLTVGVHLSAPADALADVLRDAVHAGEADAAGWDRVRADFEQHLTSRAGEAAVDEAGAVKPALQLPALPPAWTNRQIEAQGYAAAGGSKLKCARLAEAQAAERLVEEIRELPLSEGLALGQVAERNPRVGEALSRAAASGRTYKVEYDADGGARVWVQLDLHHVWEALHAVR